MYFLTDPLVKHAIDHFDQLPTPNPTQEDQFFATFGPGNLSFIENRIGRVLHLFTPKKR